RELCAESLDGIARSLFQTGIDFEPYVRTGSELHHLASADRDVPAVDDRVLGRQMRQSMLRQRLERITNGRELGRQHGIARARQRTGRHVISNMLSRWVATILSSGLFRSP